MATLDEILARREPVRAIAARHGARNVRVFGSVARRTDSDASDVDFLVVMDADRNLFDQAALLLELSELLGREVDVVTEAALKVRARERIMAGAVPL